MSTSTFTILTNQPALDHEHFAAYRELEDKLKATVRGDVRFDSPIVCRDEAGTAQSTGVFVSIRVAIRLPMVST